MGGDTELFIDGDTGVSVASLEISVGEVSVETSVVNGVGDDTSVEDKRVSVFCEPPF